MNNEKYNNFYHYNRNYGCRLKEITYKGFNSLILENEKLRLLINIDKGSDIVEFLYKPYDIDFLWKSPIEMDKSKRNPVTKESTIGSFLDEYEGGWQELLPSAGIPHNYNNTNMGAHGEIFSLPWGYKIEEDDVYNLKIKLFTRMKRTPFFVEKIISISSDNSYIDFEEKIINEGNVEFKFMWGHHPAIGKPFLSEHCFINLPKNLSGLTHNVHYNPTDILPLNKEFKWPYLIDLNNHKLNLSEVFAPEARTDFRIVLYGFDEGWFAITNPKLKIGFGLKWDASIFKYLFIWFSYCGWLNYPYYGRCYTVAPEFLSAVPDNLEEVINLGRELNLKPGESLTTKYTAIVYKSDKRIQGFDKNNSIII